MMVVQSELVVNLDANRTFDVVMIQEYIQLGQRVSQFAIDGWFRGGWVPLATGQTVLTMKLFNRTDCCASRLRNYYVFVSDANYEEGQISC